MGKFRNAHVTKKALKLQRKIAELNANADLKMILADTYLR